MNHDRLKNQVKRMAMRIEALAELPELEESDHPSKLLEELRQDLRDLYTEILELPNEADRNDLWDQIIQAFQDVGIIASAAKAIVDTFYS